MADQESTEERPVGSTTQRTHLQGPYRNSYLLLGIGGGLLAVSTLLPWYNVVFVGDMSLFRLTSNASGIGALLPWAMVAVGVVLAIGAFVGTPIDKLAKIAGVCVGVAIVLVVAGLAQSQGTSGLGSAQVGVVTAVVALVLLGVGTFQVNKANVSLRRTGFDRDDGRTVTTRPPQDRSPGWKADPWKQGSQRYWDGGRWTRQAR